jgi:hypothetical protein
MLADRVPRAQERQEEPTIFFVVRGSLPVSICEVELISFVR